MSEELNDVSEWTIFIDDHCGELAMDVRQDAGGRSIDVLAKEEIMPKYHALQKQLDEARAERDLYKKSYYDLQEIGAIDDKKFASLQKELSKIKMERDVYEKYYDHQVAITRELEGQLLRTKAKRDDLKIQLDSLKRENEKLKSVITKWADLENPNDPIYVCSPYGELMKDAREALNQGSEG